MSCSDSSRTPLLQEQLTASLVSQIPQNCSEGFNEGHLIIFQSSYNVDNDLVIMNQHFNPNYFVEDPTATTTPAETMEALQESDSSKHVILSQSVDGFIVLTNVKELDSVHYNKLSQLVHDICDKLIEAKATTCIPAMRDKLFRLKQNLSSPAEKDTVIQQQYDELMEVLKGLLHSSAIHSTIEIDEAYRRLQFQECVGHYSPSNLVEIIKKINRKVTSQSQCIIL